MIIYNKCFLFMISLLVFFSINSLSQMELIGRADQQKPIRACLTDSNTTLICQKGKFSGQCYIVDVSNNIACFSSGENLQIYNVSDPFNPIQLGAISTPMEIQDVSLMGNFSYIADGDSGIRIIDITTTANPVEISYYNTPDCVLSVQVVNNYAYLACEDSGLFIIDVSNPSNPVEVSSYDTPGTARDVFVRGDYAYVADGDSGLRFINISDPYHPVEIGSCASYRRVFSFISPDIILFNQNHFSCFNIASSIQLIKINTS